MIKKNDLSKEDKKIWEDYIKDPSDIYDKDKSNVNLQGGDNITIYRKR